MNEAYERLRAFLDAWDEDTPRSLGQPQGLAGASGEGEYHELFSADLKAVLDGYRAAWEHLPLMEGMRIRLGGDDIVMICPRETSLTPNQAREVQNYLRAVQPDVGWLVLPLPADLAVLRKEDE